MHDYGIAHTQTNEPMGVLSSAKCAVIGELKLVDGLVLQ